ncbi:hypothetical protein CJU74_03330 [Pseudomonas fragi]|nr:hypothetical protein CJU74_03330 [Pseudomonas fragi]PAA25299.1 hypothetical protein CJU72_13055 [Pseudomonas fragi]
MVELAQADQMPMDATQWCVYDMVSHNLVGAGLLAILAARFVWRNREMPSRASPLPHFVTGLWVILL